VVAVRAVPRGLVIRLCGNPVLPEGQARPLPTPGWLDLGWGRNGVARAVGR
jgi:hypothetical protein